MFFFKNNLTQKSSVFKIFFSFARDRLKAREIDIQEEKIRLKFKKYCRHAEKLNIFFSSKEQDTICFYIFVCVCVRFIISQKMKSKRKMYKYRAWTYNV